jgi:GDP-4-dehydro-6-deoxy-D-mannose reductase
MKVVVTGAEGFVGPHVVRTLESAGHDVVPLTFHDHDLTTSWPDVGPIDGIVHLAGLSAVGPSFDDPQRYIDVNSAMVTHLFEALLAAQASTRVLVISSGAVYGSGEGRPVDEHTRLDVTSPYVVSKLLVETQVAYYRRRGIDAVVARPFNHIGPGQGPGFIVPDLATRLRALGEGDELPTGNLDGSRDYTDVRDVARAYQALLELPNPKHGIYNVASGTPHSGHDVLAALCEALGREVPPTRQELTRAVDPSTVTGDATRLREETDWTPEIPFDQSIRDFVGR